MLTKTSWWLSRVGMAALGAAALAGCSSGSGDVDVSRPPLVAPPGDMATQALILMKGVTGETAKKTLGTLALLPASTGTVLRFDLRNAAKGTLTVTLHENADCGPGETDGGGEVPAGAAGAVWAPGGGRLRMPPLKADEEGVLKDEFLVQGLEPEHVRGRSIVLSNNSGRVACGISF